MAKPLDVTGKQFGRLTAIESLGAFPGGHRWKCLCSCGQTTNVCIGKLTSGCTQSCGCLQRERAAASAAEQNRKHGDSKSPEYGTWINMILRCQRDPNYAGRGIKVCPQWAESYEKFLSDVGRRPTEAHTLDRINNDGDYEPTNVRWATRKEQSRNKQNTLLITIGTETKCLKEWTEHYQLSYNMVRRRLRRGWSVEQAFNLE